MFSLYAIKCSPLNLFGLPRYTLLRNLFEAVQKKKKKNLAARVLSGLKSLPLVFFKHYFMDYGGVYMMPVRVSFWYELSISYRVYMDDTNIDTGMTHEPKQ